MHEGCAAWGGVVCVWGGVVCVCGGGGRARGVIQLQWNHGRHNTPQTPRPRRPTGGSKQFPSTNRTPPHLFRRPAAASPGAAAPASRSSLAHRQWRQTGPAAGRPTPRGAPAGAGSTVGQAAGWLATVGQAFGGGGGGGGYACTRAQQARPTAVVRRGGRCPLPSLPPRSAPTPLPLAPPQPSHHSHVGGQRALPCKAQLVEAVPHHVLFVEELLPVGRLAREKRREARVESTMQGCSQAKVTARVLFDVKLF